MDIKVTFPKKPANKKRLKPSLEHFREKGLIDNYKIYFKIGLCPAKGNVIFGKDRVYYGWKNKFRGFLVVKEIRAVKAGEAKRLSNWDKTAGNFIVSYARTWQTLDKPISYEKGFRSFQYWSR